MTDHTEQLQMHPTGKAARVQGTGRGSKVAGGSQGGGEKPAVAAALAAGGQGGWRLKEGGEVF